MVNIKSSVLEQEDLLKLKSTLIVLSVYKLKNKAVKA